MCLALAALYPSRSIETLRGLPWKEAKVIASKVAAAYRATPTEGLYLLLVILCQSRLETFLRVYPESTPAHLAHLLTEGASKGRTPWNYARQRLWAETRKRGKSQEAEAQSEPPGSPRPESDRWLDIEQIWQSLPPKTQETLHWIANQGSAEDLAVERELGLRAAQKQIKEAREAFQEALQKLSSKK